MIERPRTHNIETAEQTAALYLANLGLTWEELQGEKVLDIGAMDAAFENAARRRGVEVVSVDQEVVEGAHMPPIDSRFVIARATKLPFKDVTFGHALAHMSVTNYLEKGYTEDDYHRYIEDSLREICRVLKPGGQYRFTAGPSEDAREIESEHQQMQEIARNVGFSELKLEQYPDSHPPKEEYLLSHYYIAVKPEEKSK